MTMPADDLGVPVTVSVSSVVDIGQGLYRVRTQTPDGIVRYVLIPQGPASLTMVRVSAAAVHQLLVMGVLTP